MTPSLDRWTRGWRGPSLAALVALLAALPAVLALPATDRAEARFALASVQMLEDGDFTTPDADEAGPARLGLHWLQAAGAALGGQGEGSAIWSLRLAALLAAMAASAACAWGAAALFGSGAGFLAGALLGSSLLLSTAAAIDTPGAIYGAGVTLSAAALARLVLAAQGASPGGAAAGFWTRACLWLGVALSALAAGVAGPGAVVLMGAAIFAMERRAPWLRSLGWGWGLILVAAVVGPAALAGAIGGGSGGAAWWMALGPVRGVRAPGFHLLAAGVGLYPFTLLLPAALAQARRVRREAAVRLALAWLVPAWLVLEFTPGQRLDAGLVAYGALAWLCAAATGAGVGPTAARLGAGLQVLAAAVLIPALLYAALRFGGSWGLAWALGSGILIAGAALGGAVLLVRGRTLAAVALAGGLGMLAHAAIMAGLAPQLRPLWVAQRAAEALGRAGLDPRDGAIPAPVAVAGFDEPSLDYALGGQAEDGTAEEAAQAVRGGRAAILASDQEQAFLKALGADRPRARRAASVDGFDYVKGAPVRLLVYAPLAARSHPGG